MPELGDPLKETLMRMYVSGDGYKKLPGRSFPARAPWLGSLKRDWAVRPAPTEWGASGGMTGVDYMPALFGFARMRPDIFSKFAYPLDSGKGGRKKCEAALYRRTGGEGWGFGEINDGDFNTLWGCADKFCSIAIDLTKQHLLESVSIHWEAAQPHEYDIEVGLDGKHWTTAKKSVKLGSDYDWKTKTKTTTFGAGVQARWIRILPRDPKTEYGFKIYELSACGFPVNNSTTPTVWYTRPPTPKKTTTGE